MAKTIIIMDAPDSALGIEEIGEENPYFLGAFGEVVAVLKQTFPKGDFTDPTDISASAENGAIRIELAKHTPVQSFMMHLENAEDLSIVKKLCDRTNWRALDTDTGLFIDSKTKDDKSTKTHSTKSWWQLWKK